MSIWLGVVVAICVVMAPRALGPAAATRHLFGRRTPDDGVASRWTGFPAIVGATTVGLAVAALRMGAGPDVLAHASLGAARILAAAQPLVVIPLLISVA